MKRFFSILLLNIWYSLRRNGKESMPAVAAVLSGVIALLVSSNVAASTSPDVKAKVSTPTVSHMTASDQTGAVWSLLAAEQTGSSKHPASRHHRTIAKLSRPVTTGVLPTTNTSTTNNDPSVTNVSSNGSNAGLTTTAASLQLSSTQTTCEQGQPTYDVSSAQLTLPAPATDAGMMTWYWETQVTAGTNSSGAPPISGTQTSQSFAAGATGITITAADPSQPLVDAPGSNNYAYNFRLHVLIGSEDVMSNWVSVPQAGSC